MPTGAEMMADSAERTRRYDFNFERNALNELQYLHSKLYTQNRSGRDPAATVGLFADLPRSWMD